MSDRNSAAPSPESLARAERRRREEEEGAKAMADIQRNAIAVRENMLRLRALRVAKEEERRAQPTAPASSRTGRKSGASK